MAKGRQHGPHSPHGVHGDDPGRPADTGSSNYATMYVSIEATKLVRPEYNNPNLNQHAIKLISKTSNTSKNIINSKREVPTNKDIPIETKAAQAKKNIRLKRGVTNK